MPCVSYVVNFKELGAILIDSLKAHDYIPHNQLAAKLEFRRADNAGLSVIHDYLFRCRQRLKIRFSYSYWYYKIGVALNRS